MPKEEKDKDLEAYFRQAKRQPIPHRILDGYTAQVLAGLHHNRLLASPGLWISVGLGAAAAAMGLALALLKPWATAPSEPSPAIAATAADAVVLEQVLGVQDLPLPPEEDILPMLEVMDTFVLAMADSATPTPALSPEQEAAVLSAFEEGQDATIQYESPDDLLDTLDEIETEETLQQARRGKSIGIA